MINKYSGTCSVCGDTVLPGQGEAYKAWDNQADDMVWKVKHSDKETCEAIKALALTEGACAETWETIKGYIKVMGVRTTSERYGATIVYDGRRGYNQAGWILTTDDNGTIYLTSSANLDGWDLSETYTLTETDDDGFGNSNADIISILAELKGGKPASDLAPFAL